MQLSTKYLRFSSSDEDFGVDPEQIAYWSYIPPGEGDGVHAPRRAVLRFIVAGVTETLVVSGRAAETLYRYLVARSRDGLAYMQQSPIGGK